MAVVGRLVTGSAVGLLSTSVPVYVAELSPKALRGRLVTANQLFICIGVLLGFVVDDIFKCPGNGDYCQRARTSAWRWMLASATPVAAVLIVAFAFALPESPRFLVRRKRLTAARRVLACVRSSPAHIQQELDEITAACNQPTATWRSLLRPNVLYGVYIATMLSAIQQFTGVNAVNFYAQTIIISAGFDQDHAFSFSIYIGVIKVVFVGVGMLLIDSAGRRILMIVGIAGMTLSTALLAAVFQMKEEHGSVSNGLGWLALIALFFYMGFFEISLGAVL
ncbi:hypothetical protein PTSG_01971 [Salpingoeca rosetta]|uniref:Major facilitator superfamily (MFS) profile domain-containing protein n=1 Tax=Salpingoeca rosetta (strain ATCC 50818 / BSB-021) TaxID=946362 RepID=F2TZH6_SALR5|nr:uncharacterized protein PTSG_01971 [Salpingoeca rosetta]EGD79000.1 hypothetical protein PTSG_01971 [Salpingoeca rosetta]|eukprot:XP_004997956.1 hypothetical protein PTSG_01971 [Salpingoeca rosetta]